MTVTPLTVTVSTDPAAPVNKVTVPVAKAATGVLALMIELLPVLSIVNRSRVPGPPEWQYCKLCWVNEVKPRDISVKYLLIDL